MRHRLTRCTALHAACSTRSPDGAAAARLLAQWCSGGDGDFRDYVTASGRAARDLEAYGIPDEEAARTRSNGEVLDRSFVLDGFVPLSLDASSLAFRSRQRGAMVVAPAHELGASTTRGETRFGTRDVLRDDEILGKRMLAAPLSAARDARGNAARDAARSKGQRDALDHVWDAALCGSLARLKAALRAEGALRARSPAGALARPPWDPVSAFDRTPRLGRTALHLVALGAARAKAHAHRAARGANDAARSRFSGADKAPPGSVKDADADHGRCARCLLQAARADVDAEDAHARTPLHYAAAAGATRVVHVLLEHGADVRIADELGLTALHLASAWGRSDAAAALRDAGASGGAKDSLSRTPRGVAGLRGKCDAILVDDDDGPADDRNRRKRAAGRDAHRNY